jgi:hypothetical protein
MIYKKNKQPQCEYENKNIIEDQKKKINNIQNS